MCVCVTGPELRCGPKDDASGCCVPLKSGWRWGWGLGGGKEDTDTSAFPLPGFSLLQMTPAPTMF